MAGGYTGLFKGTNITGIEDITKSISSVMLSLKGMSNEISSVMKKADQNFNKVEQRSYNLGKTLNNSIGNVFKRLIVDGGKLSDVVSGVVDQVSKGVVSDSVGDVRKALVESGSSAVQQLLPEITGGGGLFGKVFAGFKGITPFAKGGVVSNPSLFSYGGNGGSSVGLMGEAGSEAILPLARGNDGRLGVVNWGEKGVQETSSTHSAPININIQATDVDSFRKSRTQIMSVFSGALERSRRKM